MLEAGIGGSMIDPSLQKEATQSINPLDYPKTIFLAPNKGQAEGRQSHEGLKEAFEGHHGCALEGLFYFESDAL